MSYAIYVGRNLTADGIPYLAGYGDEPSSHWLEVVPGAAYEPGTEIEVGVSSEAAMPGPDKNVEGSNPSIPDAASLFGTGPDVRRIFERPPGIVSRAGASAAPRARGPGTRRH